MGAIGKERHEKKLTEIIEELKQKGYHVVRLDGKSPDAVATKDGKLIAVEVLGKYGKRRNYKLAGGHTIAGKKRNYKMFDDVLVFTFPYENY